MWGVYLKVIKQHLASQKSISKYDQHRIRHIEDEVYLSFIYPRLDAPVSGDSKHLLKSPFVIHPKTGNVCVPFTSLADVLAFAPSQVPTLKGLLNNLNELDVESLALQIQQSQLTPYVAKFISYVRECQRSLSALQRKARAQDSLEF